MFLGRHDPISYFNYLFFFFFFFSFFFFFFSFFFLLFITVSVGDVCLHNALNVTTNATDKLHITWISSEEPRLDFQVKTFGVARLEINGATSFPRVTVLLGMNKTFNHKKGTFFPCSIT